MGGNDSTDDFIEVSPADLGVESVVTLSLFEVQLILMTVS